jgi:hypothetical protein
MKFGVSHRNLFPKRVLCYIFTEGKVGGPGKDVMQDEKRGGGGSLIPADAKNNLFGVKMRRLPDAGVLVRIEGTY